MKNIEGIYIPNEALQISKRLTYDTNENRFLKFILLRIVKKIDMFISKYNKSYWSKDEEVINKLILMKKQIMKIFNTSFLKEVSSWQQNISASLVFSMASGYKEIYKYYLMLQKGLNINSNIFAISM